MYNSGNGVFYNGVQSVSPAAGLGDANNGLSKDAITNKVVLGNDSDDPAMPAQLLNNREIQTVGNSVIFRDNFAAGLDLKTALTAGEIDLTGVSGDVVVFKMAVGVNSSLVFSVEDDTFVSVNCGFIFGGLPVWRIRNSDGAVKFGSGGFNGSTCQVAGTITGRNFVLSQSSGTLNIDRDNHSGMLVTNTNATGLLTVALPSMFATNLNGFFLNITVNQANGIKITAPLGATINISGVISASGGSVQSTLVGSSIILSCVDPSHWAALSITGTWSVT